jgi:hypothetical protein
MSSSEVAGHSIAPTSTVSIANNHFSVEHDGSTIIMSISAGKYFSFDSIGFEIWEGLKTPVRIDVLAERLAAKHGAPADEVTRDILQFVEKLSENELLVVS